MFEVSAGEITDGPWSRTGYGRRWTLETQPTLGTQREKVRIKPALLYIQASRRVLAACCSEQGHETSRPLHRTSGDWRRSNLRESAEPLRLGPRSRPSEGFSRSRPWSTSKVWSSARMPSKGERRSVGLRVCGDGRRSGEADGTTETLLKAWNWAHDIVCVVSWFLVYMVILEEEGSIF